MLTRETLATVVAGLSEMLVPGQDVIIVLLDPTDERDQRRTAAASTLGSEIEMASSLIMFAAGLMRCTVALFPESSEPKEQLDLSL